LPTLLTAPAPTPPLTIEEKYSLSLVGNSTEVAFNDDSKNEEVTYMIKVAAVSLLELDDDITILDYNTCGTEFDKSLNLISAAYDHANKVADESDERYWELPILVDVNTAKFNTPTLPNGYFTELDGTNEVRLKFCAKSELGKSDIIKLDGGQIEESSISYTKVKFDITINMVTGFTTNLNIEEKSASTASKDAVIAYECKLSQCDGFCSCLSCMIVVRKNVRILFF
jgi:ferredoxin